MNRFETLMEALEDARNRGYTNTFKMTDQGLECEESGRVFQPGQVTVVDHDRFEGESNPDDMSVLYVVECSNGLKGTVIDAYGAYADEKLSEFIRQAQLDEAR